MIHILSQVPPEKRRGQFVAKVYPSGDFTIGRSVPPKKDKGSDPLGGIEDHELFGICFTNRQPEIEPDGLELWKIAQEYEKAGNESLAYRFGQRAGHVLSADENCQGASAPMGLSSVTNSHNKPKLRRGEGGITVRGKRMLRSCAAILEENFGRECLTFGTATLPTLDTDELRLVCASWADITRKFFQEVVRLLERRGMSTMYCFCNEIQPKRFDSWGQVCPHLHWVMQGRSSKRSHWAILPVEIREIWERVLGNLLGRSVDGSAATRIEKPKKSLRAELGKYISKGGEVITKIAAAGRASELPSSWWGASRDLKNLVKLAIRRLTGDQAEAFIDQLEDFKQQGLLYYYPICIQRFNEFGEVFEIKIGFFGWIRNLQYQLNLMNQFVKYEQKTA